MSPSYPMPTAPVNKPNLDLPGTPQIVAEAPQTTPTPSTDQDDVMELYERARITVKVKDPKGKHTRTLILYEAGGDVRDQYILAAEGNKKATGEYGYFAGLQALLLRGNVMELMPDKTERPLSDDEIDKLGATMQTALNDRAKKIAGFGKDAEAEAKND